MVSSEFFLFDPLKSWRRESGRINKVMFEVMRYFGLNHRPSSGVKWKLIELRVTFTLESQIPNMK